MDKNLLRHNYIVQTKPKMTEKDENLRLKMLGF